MAAALLALWAVVGYSFSPVAVRLRSSPLRRAVCPRSQLAEELVDLRSTLEALEALAHHDSEAQAVGAPAEVSEADIDSMAAACSVIEALAMDERAGASLLDSSLSVASVRASAKRILASNAPHAAKLGAVAELADQALGARRPYAAWAAISAGVARVERWRSKGGGDVPLGRRMLQALLCTLAATRNLPEFVLWLRKSETELGEALNAEPGLLSATMAAAAEVGWEQHALAMNASLADAGFTPSTEAVNALMEARLASSERGGEEARQRGATRALDAFVHMRLTRAPPPNRASHALAVVACGRRKASWSSLRNLMRRPWLKIPWNPASANAAVGALVQAGNLRGASSAATYLADSRMPATSSPFLELLRFASGPRADSDETRQVFEALERRLGATGAPMPAKAVLLLLRRTRPPARQALLLRGARDCATAADAVTLLGAMVVHWASQGQGARAAAVLRWMHTEGYDTAHADSSGCIASAFCDQLPPPQGVAALLKQRVGRAAHRDVDPRLGVSGDGAIGWSEGGGEAGDIGDAVSRAGAATGGVAGADAPMGGCLWSLTLRASVSADNALLVGAALEATGVISLEVGTGRELGVELLGACCACGGIDAAAVILRRMGPHAPPLAYVLLVEACCAEEVPSMVLAQATVGAMGDAGALRAAAMPEVIRLYVALIRGFGALAQLEQAYAVYQEARQWLVDASVEWNREQEAECLAREAREAREPQGDPAAAAAEGVQKGLGRKGRRRQRRRGDGDENLLGEEMAGGARGGEFDPWKEADGTFVKAMVDAAAGLPGGLVLSCRLLEGAIERGSITRVDGYYQQLIHGHATAEDLYTALDTLRQGGPSLGGGYRATDATIAALMRALRLRDAPSAWASYIDDRELDQGMLDASVAELGRQRALGTLRGAGVQLERKVADYLTGGRRLRGKGLDNANDVLADDERRGRKGGESDVVVRARRSASVGAIRLEGFEGGAVARPAAAETKELYLEFEEMLALRDEREPRTPGGPPPKRDTKRNVPVERLRNAPERRL